MNTIIVEQVIILILMMTVGFFLRKQGVFTNEVNKGLSYLLVNITLPAMILYSFNFAFSMELLTSAAIMLSCAFGIHISLILLSMLFYGHFSDPKKYIFKFSTVFSNCGFVGFPVVQGLLGNIGVFYTSIFTIPFNLFMWSYGVSLFMRQKSSGLWKNVLKNPPLIATMTGLLVFLLSLQLPSPVLKTLGSIGNMTTPISMFIIGSMLADVKPKDVFNDFSVYYLSVIKLLAAPVLTCYALRFFNTDPTLVAVSVILVAMPSATMVGVFAEKYNSDKALASKCAFMTTILSMLTIPLVIAIL